MYNVKITNRINYEKLNNQSSLVMIDSETDWIQFLQNQGYKIFYKADLLPDLITSIDNNSQIVEAFHREDVRLLGFLRELCLERSKGKFMLPLFATHDIDKKWRFTCGNSRALANQICRTPHTEYNVVYISRNNLLNENFTEIVNLAQFEEIFDISWLDYTIGMTRFNDTEYSVITSIIRHSMYDVEEIDSNFGYSGDKCYGFWKRFVDEKQRIPITITCTKQTRDLIIVDPLFDVTWDEQTRCMFSFKWMLEKYQEEGVAKLYCLIDSITEPFKLHSLIPFMHRDYTGYHTEDQKLALVSPHTRSSFQLIPNIVK